MVPFCKKFSLESAFLFSEIVFYKNSGCENVNTKININKFFNASEKTEKMAWF